ncbi:MAG: UrcA family protein [Sandaracinobacter sp.]
MKTALILGAFALIASATAANAQADVMVTSDYLQMGWEKVSTQIPYGDLNLATDQGVETLRECMKSEANKKPTRCAASPTAAPAEALLSRS